jgi:DNA-binding transcriptional LysR family regulator
MTQPPLSRAIKQLETDLGTLLLLRSSAGVSLTQAGEALYDEARTLLEQADQARDRVTAVAGAASVRIGTLGDSVEQAGTTFAAAFREHHPAVQFHIREADFTDPTTGLRAGLVDFALTRMPFDDEGIATLVLRSDPVGVVLQAGDPLAQYESLHLRDLADRSWCRLPEGTDALWRAYWSGGSERAGPIVRTVQECLQAIRWNGSIGLAPLTHALPDGVVAVPVIDQPPSNLVAAWSKDNPSPLIRSFAQIAAALCKADSRGQSFGLPGW